MMDFLFSREIVITLAILGGVCSLVANWCQKNGKASEQAVKLLNKVSYVFMGVSIFLFIGAGLFGTS